MPIEQRWPGDPVFCSQCGTALEERQTHGGVRPVCPACGFIAYRSPSIGVAVLLRDAESRVLLIKRGPTSTKPGLWAVPAGFMDYGEDVRKAAARELHEETGLHADVGDVVFVASNWHDPSKLTVGIWFAGTHTGGTLLAGDDAVDAAWFGLDELPPLAFETDTALFERLRAAETG